MRPRVRVGHPHVRPAEQEPGGDEDRRARDGRDRQPAVEARTSPAQPDDRGDQPDRGQQVGEREAEREADRQLPGGDRPSRDHPRRPAEAVAAQAEGEGQRDPAAGDDLHVAVLLQPEGRERERRPGDRRSPPPEPELARQQIGAGERQRVGEQEEQVVAEHRGLRTRSKEPRRGVADQGVGEGERVAQGPELVRLKEVERLVGEGVAVPGHLPRLRERIPEVLGDVCSQVQDERPVHDHREQAGARDEHHQLACRDPLTGLGHPRHACRVARAGSRDATTANRRRFARDT